MKRFKEVQKSQEAIIKIGKEVGKHLLRKEEEGWIPYGIGEKEQNIKKAKNIQNGREIEIRSRWLRNRKEKGIEEQDENRGNTNHSRKEVFAINSAILVNYLLAMKRIVNSFIS